MDEPLKPDFGAVIGKPRAPKRKVAPAPAEADDAQLAAAAVIDSTRLEGKTEEELAELAIRRMANVVLLGGDEFMPKSLAEATSAAKSWAQIASLAKARANGRGMSSADADDDATSHVAKRLLAMVKSGDALDRAAGSAVR
jgi:hypothetical protein